MKKVVCVLIFLFVQLVLAQELPKVKNVIVILADDHALKVTGAYGNDIIKTPNIDKLSEQGITFTNAYCNSPICSASRQSLLTGKYPHATGVNLLFTPFNDEGNVTIAEHLKNYNYRTALIGKTHFNNWVWYSLYKNGLPKHGFDTLIQKAEYNEFYKNILNENLPLDQEYYKKDLKEDNIAEWMNCRTLPHPVRDKNSSGTFFANEAIKFMNENGSKPFFMWLAFYEPHHPYYFPIEYADKYNPTEMPLPKGSPEDDRWIPKKFRDLTDNEKRGIIASYYTSTEYMDKNIGLVLDALDKNGQSDNTLVIYISDNGYLLNDHKRFEKHTMWEEAVNQPMIIRVGGAYRENSFSEAIVEYIDVAPTILDIIDIPQLNESQGKSFINIVNGENEYHKDYAFAEYLEDNLAMVATKDWKYMYTTGSRDLGIGYETGFGPSGITHRLYDLRNDPNETTNIADQKEFSEIFQQMKEYMLNRFIETHPEADRLPKGLTTDGKLMWFCEPRDIGSDQSQIPVPVRVYEN